MASSSQNYLDEAFDDAFDDAFDELFDQHFDQAFDNFTVQGRIHATNNEFQRYGPKGFMEIKILENDNLYVRVDLPGVPDDGVRHRVDSVRQKVVFFSCEETLSDGDDKKNAREYAGTAGLGCDCCEITGVDAKMKDGMLRMIVSRGQQVYSLFPSQQRFESLLSLKKIQPFLHIPLNALVCL
ncbi:putative 57 kDa heat shock protein [Brassica napus]|uniref:putative 57 kDa heat shock protein n=1 Tax=Brassica napus TaxID=3708 RepID=UPI002078EF3F|nr:putative 57 kDa heat shock protein [Brassica napus]